MKAKKKRTSKPNKHTSNFVDATRSFFGNKTKTKSKGNDRPRQHTTNKEKQATENEKKGKNTSSWRINCICAS